MQCVPSSPIHFGSSLLFNLSLFSCRFVWDDYFLGVTEYMDYGLELQCSLDLWFIWLWTYDVVPARGFSVAFVRFTAVCSLSMVFNLVFGAVSLCFLYWWQFERKLTIWLLQLNMSVADFHYPVASFVKLFFFPNISSYMEWTGCSSVAIADALLCICCSVCNFSSYTVCFYSRRLWDCSSIFYGLL